MIYRLSKMMFCRLIVRSSSIEIILLLTRFQYSRFKVIIKSIGMLFLTILKTYYGIRLILQLIECKSKLIYRLIEMVFLTILNTYYGIKGILQLIRNRFKLILMILYLIGTTLVALKVMLYRSRVR